MWGGTQAEGHGKSSFDSLLSTVVSAANSSGGAKQYFTFIKKPWEIYLQVAIKNHLKSQVKNASLSFSFRISEQAF